MKQKESFFLSPESQVSTAQHSKFSHSSRAASSNPIPHPESEYTDSAYPQIAQSAIRSNQVETNQYHHNHSREREIPKIRTSSLAPQRNYQGNYQELLASEYLSEDEMLASEASDSLPTRTHQFGDALLNHSEQSAPAGENRIDSQIIRPQMSPVRHSDQALAHSSLESPILGAPGVNKVQKELQNSLNQLVRLVANVTESYTSAIFLTEVDSRSLFIGALHTLSRDVHYDVNIGFGQGLIGWTAENAVRISVCPFENDSSTLLYYAKDQDLKSFIALPILDASNKVLGVISCDSKKSYAFAKITEKILTDCAQQAAMLITLHRNLLAADRKKAEPEENKFQLFLDKLRAQKNEKDLLALAAELPLEFVERDALVVITVGDAENGASAFYSTSNQVRVGHRLLELVCRHKKVICGERSVHAVGADESKERSFLSIPFHISQREAGSINLLSRAFESFSADEIANLERAAFVIGKELELIRLREKLVQPEATTGLLSWEQFASLSRVAIRDSISAKNSATLIRLCLTNISEIEDFLGVEVARKALLRLMRLVEQVKGSSALAGYLYGNQILVLCDRQESERILGRLHRLLERFGIGNDEAMFARGSVPQTRRGGSAGFAAQTTQSAQKLGELVSKGLQHFLVHSPRDGESLEELMAKSNRLMELSQQNNKSMEVMANASNW